MKVIKDLMQSPSSSCSKFDKLQTTADKMSQSKLTFLPVIDENESVIGTVNFNDVQKLINSDQFFSNELSVADVMKTSSGFITAYDDEAAALKIMRNNHTFHLPVVDEKNQLKGVVSFMTLARRIVVLKQQLGRDAEKLRVRGLGLTH
jgi:CBS domain-containing protein